MVLETVGNPRATAGSESARKARSAAERRLWAEALTEYDRALEADWDQPSAHYGRAVAVLARAAESGAPVADDTVRAAAESFAQAVRYGRTTAQVVAARAALAAVALFDRIGAVERGEEVLREAAEGIPGSPELLFVAGKRLRAPEFLARAAKLDPTLLADPLWPEQPWAEPVNSAVLERQHAALTDGERALRTVPMEKPLTCAAGLHALRDLVAALRRAEGELTGPATHDFRLQRRRLAAEARLAAADAAFRQGSAPVPVIVVAVLTLPAVVAGGLVGGYWGAGIVALVCGVALAVLVPDSLRRRRVRGERVLAARSVAEAANRELQQRREQRARALDAVRAAHERAEGLIRRAPIALTL